ncbi:MAG: hypothetical protein ACK44Q_14415, partial [Pirellulaceae bacterium]
TCRSERVSKERHEFPGCLTALPIFCRGVVWGQGVVPEGFCGCGVAAGVRMETDSGSLPRLRSV